MVHFMLKKMEVKSQINMYKEMFHVQQYSFMFNIKMCLKWNEFINNDNLCLDQIFDQTQPMSLSIVSLHIISLHICYYRGLFFLIFNQTNSIIFPTRCRMSMADLVSRSFEKLLIFICNMYYVPLVTI